MAFTQEVSDAHPHVVSDLAEVSGRVPIPEIPGPAAQERIDVPHDRFSIERQAVPVREFTNPVPCMPHRLTELERRGSASGCPPSARVPLVRCGRAVYAGGMRYPDGGGLSPAARGRRETVRVQAAQMFAADVPPVQVGTRLRGR